MHGADDWAVRARKRVGGGHVHSQATRLSTHGTSSCACVAHASHSVRRSLGHFLMCFDSAGGFTDACADARSHFDPGAFGFIPVLDSTAPGTDDRVWLTDE